MNSIMTFDPGARNFAWAFLAGATFRTGMLNVLDGKPEDMVTAFREEIGNLLTQLHPTHVVIERFMTRPGRSSPNNETINLLIGVVLCRCAEEGLPAKAITSSVWKSAFRRKSNMPADDVKVVGKTDHECDALGMAAYESDNEVVLSMMAMSALVTSIERAHRTRKQMMLKKEINNAALPP